MAHKDIYFAQKAVRWAAPWDELISAPLGVSQAAGRLGLNYPKAPSSCVSRWYRSSAESSAGATGTWILHVVWAPLSVVVFRVTISRKGTPGERGRSCKTSYEVQECCFYYIPLIKQVPKASVNSRGREIKLYLSMERVIRICHHL